MRLSIAFPNPDKRPKSAYSPRNISATGVQRGGLCLLRTYPTSPCAFPGQYHWTALLMPLRLSYFSASVSVEALQRKVKLYDVYGASTTDALILKQ